MLSTLIDWLKMHVPHVESHSGMWGNPDNRAIRLYLSPRPYGLRCLFDYTRASFYANRPAWVRVRLLGFVVFERNHHLSGLPGARVNG